MKDWKSASRMVEHQQKILKITFSFSKSVIYFLLFSPLVINCLTAINKILETINAFKEENSLLPLLNIVSKTF